MTPPNNPLQYKGTKWFVVLQTENGFVHGSAYFELCRNNLGTITLVPFYAWDVENNKTMDNVPFTCIEKNVSELLTQEQFIKCAKESINNISEPNKETREKYTPLEIDQATHKELCEIYDAALTEANLRNLDSCNPQCPKCGQARIEEMNGIQQCASCGWFREFNRKDRRSRFL